MTEVDIDLVGRDQATSVIGNVTGALGGLGDIAGGAVAFALGGVLKDAFDAVTSATGEFFKSALDAEQQQAGLAALLKSTGGAAGLTADQVNGLAAKFRDLVGGSDEAVVSIEEVGIRSGSINAQEMPEFIKNVADLGAVMGDTSAAATLLARAQEDPAAAFKRIERATGSYDKALEQQIAHMVKAGDVAGATKLIMDRVAETTGGAAAANADTLAGRWEILQNHLEDAGKGIVAQLLPPLEQLFDTYIAPNIPIIEQFASTFAGMVGDIIGQGGDLGVAFDDLREGLDGIVPESILEKFGVLVDIMRNNILPAITDVIAMFQNGEAPIDILATAIGDLFGPEFEGHIDGALTAMQEVWAWVTGELIPLLAQLGAILLTGLGPTIKQLGDAWTNQALPALQTVWAWMQANLMPLLADLWTWLKANLPIALQTLVNFWNDVLLPALINFYGWYWSNLGRLFADLWAWLATVLPPALTTLANFWTGTLQPAMQSVWAWIQNPLLPDLNTLWVWLNTTLTAALQNLSNFWSNTLQPAMLGVWKWMQDPLFPFLSSLGNLIGTVLKLAVNDLSYAWSNTLQPALTGVYNFIVTSLLPKLNDVWSFLTVTFAPVFTTVGNAINGLVSGAMAALKGILDTINGALRDATTAVNGLIGLINAIPHVPSVGGGGSSSASTTYNSSSSSVTNAPSVTVNVTTPDQVLSAYGTASAIVGAY